MTVPSKVRPASDTSCMGGRGRRPGWAEDFGTRDLHVLLLGLRSPESRESWNRDGLPVAAGSDQGQTGWAGVVAYRVWTAVTKVVHSSAKGALWTSSTFSAFISPEWLQLNEPVMTLSSHTTILACM